MCLLIPIEESHFEMWIVARLRCLTVQRLVEKETFVVLIDRNDVVLAADAVVVASQTRVYYILCLTKTGRAS